MASTSPPSSVSVPTTTNWSPLGATAAMAWVPSPPRTPSSWAAWPRVWAPDDNHRAASVPSALASVPTTTNVEPNATAAPTPGLPSAGSNSTPTGAVGDHTSPSVERHLRTQDFALDHGLDLGAGVDHGHHPLLARASEELGVVQRPDPLLARERLPGDGLLASVASRIARAPRTKGDQAEPGRSDGGHGRARVDLGPLPVQPVS